MKHRSVTRPPAPRAVSTHHAVLTQGLAAAVVDALHVTNATRPEHAPMGTGCVLKVPAAHTAPPAPHTRTGAQR
ncbi:MAG: hypothetical protein REI45_14090 [Propionicimonas sp.]|nr:hypothetical protein [Propionicimonas sp.]